MPHGQGYLNGYFNIGVIGLEMFAPAAEEIETEEVIDQPTIEADEAEL